MALDKTKTIHQRRVDVYLPSLEARDAWRKAAQARGQKVSGMVYAIVENAIHSQAVDEDALRDLTDERDRLMQEQAILRARIQDLETLAASKERDLQEYRAMDYMNPDKLEKPIDARFASIMADATERELTEDKICQRLHIRPDASIQRAAVAAQIEFFEKHGVIRRQGSGWVWNA